MIDDRVAKMRLTSIFPGVYGLGPGLTSQRGRWMGATLASGSRVVLSHRSAAMLWGLEMKFDAAEVLSASMRRTRIDAYRSRGLIVHQTRSLPDDQITVIDGIPVTTLSRTLVDLASILNPRQVEALFNQADRLKILDLENLIQLTETGRGRRGNALLKKLAQRRDPRNRLTRSELESRFLLLCAENGLPMPKVNTKVRGFEVDCFWPSLRFIVELDGLSYHSSWADIERDHKRDAELQEFGFLVLRLTYRAVTDTPRGCVQTLRAHLNRAQEIVAKVPA